MGSNLSKGDKDFFEKLLEKTTPYDEDDPILDQLDGERDHDRMMALIAKKILEGRFEPLPVKSTMKKYKEY